MCRTETYNRTVCTHIDTQPHVVDIVVHTYVHTCTSTHTHTYSHTHLHTHTHSHRHTHTHNHTHLHTLTHTHAHTQLTSAVLSDLTTLPCQETALKERGSDLSKVEAELSSLNIKLKWAQNKLKVETEEHVSCKAKLQNMSKKWKEAKEEGDQLRAELKATVQTYQVGSLSKMCGSVCGGGSSQVVHVWCCVYHIHMYIYTQWWGILCVQLDVCTYVCLRLVDVF